MSAYLNALMEEGSRERLLEEIAKLFAENEQLRATRPEARLTEAPMAWMVFTPTDPNGMDYYVYATEEEADRVAAANDMEKIPLYRAAALGVSPPRLVEPTLQVRILCAYCHHEEGSHDPDCRVQREPQNGGLK